jgi:hypothetical protein
MPIRARKERFHDDAMIPSVRGRIDARGSAPTIQWDPNTGTLRLDWEDVPEAWLEIQLPPSVQHHDGGDDEDSGDSDGGEQQPVKRFKSGKSDKSDKSSVEAPRATQAGETPVGTV